MLHKIGFPKIHDMIQLEELVAQTDPEVRSIHDYLAEFNPYGIAIRYPGLEATIPEAKKAITMMRMIRKFFRGKLGLK